MQQREKILATFLGTTLVLFVVVPKMWSWFNGPVEEIQKRLDDELERREKKDLDLTQTLAKQRRLKEWKGRSLSPKDKEAALQYQQWLTDLAEVVAEFSNVKVAPEPSAAAANQPYVAVRFRLNAEATLAQLRMFLFRFHQADVLHGITRLGIESPSTTGNPRLTLVMQFEALSLKDGPPRGPSLFARTEVAEDWLDATKPLRVKSADAFPTKTPFLVRVGRQYFEVRDANGTIWSLKPETGAAKTSAALEAEERADRVPVDETIELVRVHPEFEKRTLTDFDAILKQNPFLKPVAYAPKLEFVGTKSVSRGQSLELTCRASGFDLSLGAPSFALAGDVPEGMAVEHSTGKITWKPSDELPLGDVKVRVAVTAPGLKSPISDAATITLKMTNKPPVIVSIGARHAVLSKEFVFKVKATDDDSEGPLKFSLGSGGPEGAKIDEATGEFRWTPPATFVPGPVKVSVKVTDTGLPPMSTTQEFMLTVGDDLAQFTELTGIFVKDGRKEFWLTDKSTNKQLVLHEGETLRYADIEAKIERIELKAIFLRKDEASWRLDLGETLKNLKKLEPPAPSATEKEKTVKSSG